MQIILKCENNQLITSPSIFEIYSAFHSFIDNIANTARYLPSLESWLNVKTSNEFIPVTLPEWYLQKSHQLLGQNLEVMFQPLNNYIESLQRQFSFIYSSETHQEIINYVAEGHDFTTYLDKVEEFKSFFWEINQMVILFFILSITTFSAIKMLIQNVYFN